VTAFARGPRPGRRFAGAHEPLRLFFWARRLSGEPARNQPELRRAHLGETFAARSADGWEVAEAMTRAHPRRDTGRAVRPPVLPAARAVELVETRARPVEPVETLLARGDAVTAHMRRQREPIGLLHTLIVHMRR
jgi:hypothetical protein